MVLLAAFASALRAQDYERIEGLAIVQSDGSLRLDGRTVRLYGIFIPLDDRTCSSVVRPTRCGSPAVLILDDRASQGFVHCQVVRGRGEVVDAYCTAEGRYLGSPRVDLGGSLVADGWALAGPEAPPQYVALERLARSREAGLWGDKITNFR